jgi:hypothetical protein
MRLKQYLEEEVLNFLSKKLEKLKKKHGYLSKSMLTKKELQQLKKSGGEIK